VKRCTKCGEEKPLDEFHKSARSSDGRQYWCKVCLIAAARQSAQANPEAKRRADRKYSASEKNKANRKVRREGPQRETILEQKRQSWDRHKEENARRAREARKRDPERFREYYRRKYEKDREKILEQNRAWAVANPDKVRAIKLRHDYGTTPEEVDQKLLEQGGLCEICQVDLEQVIHRNKDGTVRGSGICIDHCHETGKVRGIICSGCNKALGYFKDDPARMRAGADYIEKYRASANAEPRTA
jgi:hypothetical protein